MHHGDVDSRTSGFLEWRSKIKRNHGKDRWVCVCVASTSDHSNDNVTPALSVCDIPLHVSLDKWGHWWMTRCFWMINRASSPPSHPPLPPLPSLPMPSYLIIYWPLSATVHWFKLLTPMCTVLCSAERRVSVVLTTYDLAIRDLALLRKQGAGSDRYLMLLALSFPFFLSLPLSLLFFCSVFLSVFLSFFPFPRSFFAFPLLLFPSFFPFDFQFLSLILIPICGYFTDHS